MIQTKTGFILLIIGVVIGFSLAYSDVVDLSKIFGKKYYVKEIKSHYEYESANSHTTLIVFVKGNAGHVKEILCQFPPQQIIHQAFLKKVKVYGVSQEYASGSKGYFCGL